MALITCYLSLNDADATGRKGGKICNLFAIRFSSVYECQFIKIDRKMDLVTNYGPILIFSTITKVFESTVYSHIFKYVRNKLSPKSARIYNEGIYVYKSIPVDR